MTTICDFKLHFWSPERNRNLVSSIMKNRKTFSTVSTLCSSVCRSAGTPPSTSRTIITASKEMCGHLASCCGRCKRSVSWWLGWSRVTYAYDKWWSDSSLDKWFYQCCGGFVEFTVNRAVKVHGLLRVVGVTFLLHYMFNYYKHYVSPHFRKNNCTVLHHHICILQLVTFQILQFVFTSHPVKPCIADYVNFILFYFTLDLGTSSSTVSVNRVNWYSM